MKLSTITCVIWKKLKVSEDKQDTRYQIFFKGSPLIVDGNSLIFIVENTRNILHELNKYIDMGQFSKIIIDNNE